MYDVVIIGGGIVGLATAYQISGRWPGMQVALLEKEADIAQHQTGHNSGVIHSGIYYKPGSLKAKNCFRGYGMLLDFCRAEKIPYEICGKVIVATRDDELPRLRNLFERGSQNGLDGLRWLNREQLLEIEPHCAGIAAVEVPQTGIISFPEVAKKLREKLQARGVHIRLQTKVEKVEASEECLTVHGGGGEWKTRFVIGCAGLQSDRLADSSGLKSGLRIVPFKGEYFLLKPEKRHLLKGLIYPVPDPAFPFLGVHLTRTIDGDVEVGPNAVLALDREAYRKFGFSARDAWSTLTWPGFYKIVARHWRTGIQEVYRSLSREQFARALRRLVPEISADDLVPIEPGIRAQACMRDGTLIDDFALLSGDRQIHVCNAPSPAATSCLSIGLSIADEFATKFSGFSN